MKDNAIDNVDEQIQKAFNKWIKMNFILNKTEISTKSLAKFHFDYNSFF